MTSNLVVRWEANEIQAGSSFSHKIATCFFHVEKQKSRRHPPTLGQCQGLEVLDPSLPSQERSEAIGPAGNKNTWCSGDGPCLAR